MLGYQHFTLSVGTAFVILAPFFHTKPEIAGPILLGVSIGSLIPDVDATDATVFHTKIKGLHRSPGKIFNKFLGPMLPLFGYLTKYLIYKPSVFILNIFSEDYKFEEAHRSFTHSLIGVTVMTLSTGLVLDPFITQIGLSRSLLLFFLTGYVTGALLHMLQDSCTKTGIAWNQPFSDLRLKGELKTGKSNRRPHYFAIMLLLVAMMNLAGSLSINEPIQILTSGLLLSAVSWTFFAWISGLRLED